MVHTKQIIFRNGRPLSATDAYDLATIWFRVPVAHETIKAYATGNGTRLFKVKEHFARLQDNCRRLHQHTGVDTGRLISDVYSWLEEHRFKNALVRIMVFPLQKEQQVIVAIEESPAFATESGLHISIEEKDRQKQHVHTLAGSLSAHAKAQSAGFDDVLFTDENARITQASSANFFMQKENRLYTPLESDTFCGITRANVLSLCRKLEIDVVETHLYAGDVLCADAAFLCSTVLEIAGVQQIGSQTLPLSWKDSLGYTLQCAYRNRVLERENFEVII